MDLIYAAALIWGIKCLFSEGQALHFNRGYLPKWVKKPLFDCPPCMSSVYGTAWYFLYYGGDLNWIVFCIMLCGLNYFIVQLVDKERIIIDEE